jgi:C4-dicarboxylate-specific signal transduction histidine kinase
MRAMQAERPTAEYLEAIKALVHRVNNHLATISGQAQLMGMKASRSGVDAELGEFLSGKIADIRAVVDRSEAYLARFRWTYNRIAVASVKTPLADLLAAAHRILDARLGEESTVRLEADPGIEVIADPTHTPLALAEILENAELATSSKGTVETSIAREGGVARIQVTDTGRGASEESLARAFQPFYSGWEEMERPGLGLFIASTVIVGAGGRVVLRSDGEGAGAECTVELTLAEN